MSMEYKMGLFFGVLAGALAGLLFVALMKHKKVIDCHFDERQERARGQAFKYAFFTLAVAVICYGALDTIFTLPCDTLTAVFLCFCLTMVVFAVVCIRKEAYLSLYEKPGQVMMLFGVIAAFNIGIGAIYLMEGTMVENGVLTFRACNLIVGVMMLVIMGIYALHISSSGEEEAE
ncbi:MAG: hypothetical protein IJE22_07540 [Oscillibacter sp.]|nr:hypothetical protein [Oscillibacter sp.]